MAALAYVLLVVGFLPGGVAPVTSAQPFPSKAACQAEQVRVLKKAEATPGINLEDLVVKCVKAESPTRL